MRQNNKTRERERYVAFFLAFFLHVLETRGTLLRGLQAERCIIAQK